MLLEGDCVAAGDRRFLLNRQFGAGTFRPGAQASGLTITVFSSGASYCGAYKIVEVFPKFADHVYLRSGPQRSYQTSPQTILAKYAPM
jgi:hypothetical protein